MMGLFSFCLYKLLHKNAHSPENSSDEWAFFFPCINLPLWSLRSPPSHGSKIIIFYLSKSKCTVSALFLHGFKGCNGYSDLQNTTKGAEITIVKNYDALHKNGANSKVSKSEHPAEGLF